MGSVRLRETHVRGLYWSSDGRLFTREDGAEERCSRCGAWSHTVYRWADQRVCGRHVRVSTRTRIRMTTTFACRVCPEGATAPPPAVVMRRGDEIPVAGPPRACGKFDRFEVPGRGHVMVPRSRWAWV